MQRVDRRGFLAAVGMGGLGLAAGGLSAAESAPPLPDAAQQQMLLLSTVSEGLMYEHGFISRLLAVFAECADRLAAGKEVPAGALQDAAALVDNFVESYHEAFEEEYLYAPFGHSDVMSDLVAVMVRQHHVGRDLVDQVADLAGKPDLGAPDVGPKLTRICRAYARMYREHIARETTDVLPALGRVGGLALFAQMHGEMLSFRDEHLDGLDLSGVRKKVTDIEKSLGIADLATFTAPAET